MFQLQENRINRIDLLDQFSNPRAGAFITFEGIVRNHHEGRDVAYLEYEAHQKIAESEGKKILEEARESFDILECYAVHRTGKLEIGDIAVWIGCLASHRDACYQANRFIIEELKTRLTIWKKEFYSDGASDWVNCKTKIS
ncbi:MAG: molybdenum cofactor biosynthesis protein MoaE [Gammaproteobacteria bacterium]